MTENAVAETYKRLAAEFPETFTDTRGGFEITYITGEQVVSRLNDVLGVDGWSFEILEHGFHDEADEFWSLGKLTARFPTLTVIKEQFGSQKIKRSRASGQPLDIGFDKKGASTDALKKCASLVGVGLYLSHKEGQTRRGDDQEDGKSGSNGRSADAGGSARPGGGVRSNGAGGPAIACDECEEELTETRFRDGSVWTPAQLAAYGRRKHGRALCMPHYKEANDAKRRAEQPA